MCDKQKSYIREHQPWTASLTVDRTLTNGDGRKSEELCKEWCGGIISRSDWKVALFWGFLSLFFDA